MSSKKDCGFDDMTCNVCNLSHRTEECPLICTGIQVQDAELPSKAILTLPDTLMYKKLTDNTYEIMSKYGFSKGTQFGPLDAPKSSFFNPKCSYVLKLFSGREYFCYLDISDEENCNWMCLVPFSSELEIKNCICYQLRDKIYFTVVNDIFPGQALIVSYSPGYAAQLDASNKDKQLGESDLLSSPNTTSPSLISIGDKTSAASQLTSEDHNYISASSELALAEVDNELDTTGEIRRSSGRKRNDKNLLFETILKKEKLEPAEVANQMATDNQRKPHSIENFADLSEISVIGGFSNSDDINHKVKYSDKLNKRLGAVLAVDSWKCKFCGEEKSTISDFAAHLIQHYKLVGAARTEKSRLGQKVGNKEEIQIKEEPEEGTNDIGMKSSIRPSFPYYCDICVNHKTFNRAEYVIRHLRKHTSENYCGNCDQIFSGKEHFNSHTCISANTESEDVNVKCTLCDKEFSSQGAVKNHLKLKHGRVYKCSKCQRTFAKAGGLRKHICRRKTVQTDADISILHKCEMCNNTFIRLKDLTKHLQTHKGQFVCNYCGKNLSNDSYKMHLSICETLHCFLQKMEEILKCPQSKCTSVFKDVDTFRHHVTSHTHPFMCPRCFLRLRLNSDIKEHECIPFSCDADLCDNSFDSLNDLKKHIHESHQEINSYCYECAFPFATTKGYDTHKSYCEENLPCRVYNKRPVLPKKETDALGSFVCETCGATYSKWNSLKTHRYTHGPKKFICDVCGKGFHRRELLDDHKFVHQDAQFQCNECGKKMKSKKSLDVHSRIHSGLKRFHCEECGKSFAQKVNLTTHQYVHLKSQGFEGFPCPYCEKKFSSKEYLSFHIEGHEKGKTHHCDICGRSFVKSHMLKQHKKLTHSGVRFTCEFCDVVVRLNYSLMRHLKNRHIEYQEIWGRPGYSLERMIQCTLDGDNSGSQTTYSSRIHRLRNASSTDTFIHTELMDAVNEDETNELASQNCDISVEEHIVEFSKENVVIPQSNMVFLRMDQEGEIVLAVTEEGQTMIEVEAEVIDGD